jgi:hypothetical protein
MPSIKKSLAARTLGKATRTIKKGALPKYGDAGAGLVKDPSRAVYNKVYNKRTKDPLDPLK